MEITQKSDRYYATVITIGFHAMLLLLFIFYKIVTPLPPYPEDGGGNLGMEINFGDSQEGMGLINPDKLSAAPKVTPPPSRSQDVPLLTDDSDENYIPEAKKTKVKAKELKRPDNGPKITKKVDEPVVDNRAIYPGSKGGSQGKTGKAGNQGQKDGTDPYSPLYEGKGGKGGGGTSGTGGKGNGTGNTIGDGGKGPGGGIQFSLAGRSSLSLPKPAYTSEKSGRVVVDITVDANGNVIKARAGGRGTTVQDAELFRQAEAAAKKARFKPDNTAAEKQIGTITYNFIRN